MGGGGGRVADSNMKGCQCCLYRDSERRIGYVVFYLLQHAPTSNVRQLSTYRTLLIILVTW
jgi:hypothetical protein